MFLKVRVYKIPFEGSGTPDRPVPYELVDNTVRDNGDDKDILGFTVL